MNTLRYHRFSPSIVALIAALLMCEILIGSVVSAQVVIDNIVDTSLNRYDIRFTVAGTFASNFVLSTFILLATLELSWGMIRTYMNNGGLQDFLSEIVKRILFIGFFLFLLQRGSQTIDEILRSFDALLIRTGISDGSLSPGLIFDRGQELLARMYEQAMSIGVFDIIFDDDTSLSDPVVLLFVGLLGMIIMIIIAAHFAVVLLETFIVANAGLILLALGGSRWTHKYAVSYIKYGLSVGMKLFVLSLIVGLTLGEINRFLTTTDISDLNNTFAMIAFLLFSAVISIIAPKSIKGMMDGVSVASGASVSNALNTSNRTNRTTSRTTGQLSKSIVPKIGQ